MSDLTLEQRAAIGDAVRFARDPAPRKPTFFVGGGAGTGKTYTLARLARELSRAHMMAPTGKAAAVLRGRVDREVDTVHSVIYDYLGNHEDEDGRKRPVFAGKEDAGIAGSIALLDEARMCGTRLIEDLLATGVRVVAFGDPNQLNPVADSPYFDRPDRTLSEVHRQALESPIIRQATAIREGREARGDGDDFRVVRSVSGRDHAESDVALCWKNATRRYLNVRRRAIFGNAGAFLKKDEPVMTLRNDRSIGIFNGEVYTVAEDRAAGEDIGLLSPSGRLVTVMNPLVEGIDAAFDEKRDDECFAPMALAHAVTVHKAQGSEWDRVIVVDEMGRADERKQWLYTAVTRAAKRCTVVKVNR